MLFLLPQVPYLYATWITTETLAQALRAEARSSRKKRLVDSSSSTGSSSSSSDPSASTKTTSVLGSREIGSLTYRCGWIIVAFGLMLAFSIMMTIQILSSRCASLCGTFTGILSGTATLVGYVMAILNLVLFVITILHWIALSRMHHEKQ
jgi:hypothetical protein